MARMTDAERFVHAANKTNSQLLKQGSSVWLTNHVRYVEDPRRRPLPMVVLSDPTPDPPVITNEVLHITLRDGSSAYWSIQDTQWVIDPQLSFPNVSPPPEDTDQVTDQKALMAKIDDVLSCQAKLTATRDELTRVQEENRCLENRVDFILDDLTNSQCKIKMLRERIRELDGTKDKEDREQFEYEEMGGR